MQTLTPTAVILSNLSGSVTDLDDSPDAPDANWCTGSASEAITGLIFPSNDTSDPVRFRFSGAGNYPDIVPLTLLWKHYPVQQDGYYTTFFHSRTDGDFIATPTYFGCHPYPQGGASGTVHNWEISIRGADDIVDENANSTVVTKDQWYSQAASSRNSGPDTIIDFYWNLSVSSNRLISYTSTDVLLTNDTNSPGITFGCASWSQTENLSGRLRGIQIYASQLSQADIEALHVCDTNAAVLAVCASRSITSLWYLNMNPTPTDISDKSGNGNDPAWVDSNRPTLWEA